MDDSALLADLRTVTHAACYFEELKQAALQLAQQVEAERRGYFVPDEEDATLGLLVSYWQARNALLDLIVGLRERYAVVEPTPEAFLTGFTSALILVDGARFLREVVATRPLVQEKLNEPALQFGIPAGVYDTIQKSLVSARNGWRLLDALAYYRTHEEQLANCDERFRELHSVIGKLLPRVEVSVLDFTRAKFRTRGRQLTRRLTSHLFGRILYGIQQVVGTLMSDRYVRIGHQPHLPTEISRDLRALLRPGDVLVVRKEFALTNYFLPGYWPHAALYLGSQVQLNELGIEQEKSVQVRWPQLMETAGAHGAVLESMKDGVLLRPLDWTFRSDSIVVLRPRLSAEEIKRGVARVLVHEGKPYDFDFDFRRSDRLVCTEVVYRAYDGLGNRRIPLIRRAGRPTLAGGDLVKSAIDVEHFVPVAAFAPRLGHGLCTAEAATDILRAGSQESVLSPDRDRPPATPPRAGSVTEPLPVRQRPQARD